MQNLTIIECENEVLRAQYKALKSGAKDLIETIERYMRQDCLRSELYSKKENLKSLLK